jgi:hypothetical protein
MGLQDAVTIEWLHELAYRALLDAEDSLFEITKRPPQWFWSRRWKPVCRLGLIAGWEKSSGTDKKISKSK